MNNPKILITGSRSWKDVKSVISTLDMFPEDSTFIHGGCKSGVDNIVHNWCIANNRSEIIVRPIHPDVKINYLYRNAEMVGMCDLATAFWDGESKGTKFTIDYLTARNKIFIIIDDCVAIPENYKLKILGLKNER